MERRKLNFEAPILSTRRYSLPSNPTDQVRQNTVQNPFGFGQEPCQWNKAEQENDRVTTPGTVPFLWEQSPGRPKGGVESPGRIPGSSGYDLEERFYDHDTHQLNTDSFSSSDCDVLLVKFKKSLSCEDGPNSECGDGGRSDGAEALSQSESGGLNYSSTGLSSSVKSSGAFRVDERTRDFIMRRFLPAAKAAVLETPEHVMRKSKVLDEQPKQVREVVFEQPMPLRYRYSPSPLLDERRPHPYPCYGKLIDHMESQATIKKCAVPFKKPWKAIPRLFAKNSLCLLKPHLRTKLRSLTPPPTSEVRRLARKALSGPLDKNAFHQFLKKKLHSGLQPRELQGVGDSNQFCNNHDSIRSKISPMRRYSSGSSSPYRNEAPKSPLWDFRSANTSPHQNEVPKFPLWEYQTANASPYRNEPRKSPLRNYGSDSESTYRDKLPRSPLMDYRSGNVSPYRNEPSKSPLRGYQSAKSSPHRDEPPRSSLLPKSPLRRCESVNLSPLQNKARCQGEFCPVSEKADNQNSGRINRSQELYGPLHGVRGNQMHEKASSGPLVSSSPLVDAKEKTLYVDTINLPIPKSSYRRSGVGVDFSGDRYDVFAGTRQKERNEVKYDSSPNLSDSEEEEKVTPKFGSTNNVVYSSETFASTPFYFADSTEDTNQNQGRDRPLRTLECISEIKQVKEKERDLVKTRMPPQLPKMPSQSWLSNAAETAAKGYTSPQSRRTIYSKLQGQKGSIPDPKWQFTVKTSDLGRDHLRYSGELAPSYRQRKLYNI